MRLTSATTLRVSLLVGVHLLCVLWGVHVGVRGPSTAVGVLYSLSIAFVIVLTCVADAHVRSQTILPIFQFLMLFTWPVAVPVYLFWTRRWPGLLWAGLWMLTGWACYAIGAITIEVLRRAQLAAP